MDFGDIICCRQPSFSRNFCQIISIWKVEEMRVPFWECFVSFLRAWIWINFFKEWFTRISFSSWLSFKSRRWFILLEPWKTSTGQNIIFVFIWISLTKLFWRLKSIASFLAEKMRMYVNVHETVEVEQCNFDNFCAVKKNLSAASFFNSLLKTFFKEKILERKSMWPDFQWIFCVPPGNRNKFISS